MASGPIVGDELGQEQLPDVDGAVERIRVFQRQGQDLHDDGVASITTPFCRSHWLSILITGHCFFEHSSVGGLVGR